MATNLLCCKAIIKSKKEKSMRWPGIEPRSTAWKATMLTITPPTLYLVVVVLKGILFGHQKPEEFNHNPTHFQSRTLMYCESY